MKIIKYFLLVINLSFFLGCNHKLDSSSAKTENAPESFVVIVTRNLKAHTINEYGPKKGEIFDKQLAKYPEWQNEWDTEASIYKKTCIQNEIVSLKQHQLCQALVYEKHNEQKTKASKEDLIPCQSMIQTVSSPCLEAFNRFQISIQVLVARAGKILPPTP